LKGRGWCVGDEVREEGSGRISFGELVGKSNVVRKVSGVVDGEDEIGTKGIDDEEDEF
jgi:hypothetical protein